MKKIITLLTICITTTIFAQTTYVPDDNFENYLENNGMGNGISNDDLVTTANISGVVDLSLNFLDIVDLTGIEDFVSLETLSCTFNDLTTLDLSNNPQLINLNCKFNDITNINVSQNIALETLDCTSNQLTSLDVSNNTSLIELKSGINLLTNIDISNNTALTHLWCYNNQLNDLDISNNSALLDLSVFSNQLTSVDVSLNTNLEILLVHSNQLISLNVKNGNNTNFTDFNASSNPNLTCIQVDGATWSTANWTDIDPQSYFSENCVQPITYVPDDNFENYLENNGMGNGIPNDDSVLTANINGVTTLNISGLNIADLTGIQFFTALQNLNVNDNVLTALDLTQNQNLQNLLCQNNSIELLNLSQNPNLVNLRCQSNQLTGLNVKNGNNTAITNDNFITTNNPNLTCILVDDATWSATNWTNTDPTSTFVNNQAECTALSVEDVNLENALSIYPNPVKDGFTITNNTNITITSLHIYDILGKQVYQTNTIPKYINTSNLKQGLYFVKITTNDTIVTKRILIE